MLSVIVNPAAEVCYPRAVFQYLLPIVIASGNYLNMQVLALLDVPVSCCQPLLHSCCANLTPPTLNTKTAKPTMALPIGTVL